MDLEIAGKIALVTGGSRGIGRAIALDLAVEGCKITVVARGQAEIDGTVAAIRPAIGFSYDLANASRLAAVAVVKSAALALAPYGVTVNTIGTGSFRTDYALGWFKARAEEQGVDVEDYIAAMAKHIPVGRIGDPREDFRALHLPLLAARGFTSGDSILCGGGVANCVA